MVMRFVVGALVALIGVGAPGAIAGALALPRTVAETSGDVRTGRYDEVRAFCDAVQRAEPTRAACLRVGETPEGRSTVAIVLSEDGATSPENVAAAKRPVVWVQGGIHAGEIDGKDASLRTIKTLLTTDAGRKLLAAVTVVFVPVFNVDGHERFGAWNRPNQQGPQEMGWRTTAQNLNLNRDYMKADAPEMRAMLALMARYDPVVFVDLHVTDGAKFQHDVSIIVEPKVPAGPAVLTREAAALSAALQDAVKKSGHLPVDFYPAFEADDDPASGFATGPIPPRFAHGYAALRNRLGILVETHAWKDYKTRVTITVDVLNAIFAQAQDRARAWRSAEDAADKSVARGEDAVALAFENTSEVSTIDFLGYAYARVPSAVSGALQIVYDDSKPVVWHVPMKRGVKVATAAQPPKAGYVIPRAWVTAVRDRLVAHGIRFVEVNAPVTRRGARYRATATTFGTKPYEGRQTLRVQGDWQPEAVTIAAGSVFVPVAQPLGRLVVALFEPAGPDSFVGWGFFNAQFEQKEYMEAYVAEGVAREMLEDPKVRAAFDKKLEDPAFAKHPAARLDFFYARHPSYDVAFNTAPVVRVDEAP